MLPVGKFMSRGLELTSTLHHPIAEAERTRVPTEERGKTKRNSKSVLEWAKLAFVTKPLLG
jgi:hypothetical protein